MAVRVAVLGSNSFSGSDLVDLLLEKGGYEVLGTSRSPEKSALFLRYKRHGAGAPYRYVQADHNLELDRLIRELDAFRPEHIVNFAAQSEVAPSWEHPEHWFQTNTVALARLLQALSRREYLKRYLHVSSPEVYGTCVGRVTEEAPLCPSTPYAASKAAADLLLVTYLKQYRFPLLSVRSTNVYGAHQQLWKIIPRTAVYLKSGRKIQLHGGGTAVKSYIHIRDISEGELAILEKGRIGELYHLSPNQGVEVREVVRRMCALSGVSYDASVEVVGERPGQDAAYVIDSSKARRELAWRPRTGLEEGLREVQRWIDGNWEAVRSQEHEYRHRP